MSLNLEEELSHARIRILKLEREQKQFDEILHRHADLYDNAPVGYITFNTNGVIQETNLTAALLLEETKEHLLDRSFSRWIHPDDRRVFSDHLCFCAQSRDAKITREIRLLTEKSKKAVFVELHSIPVIQAGSGKKMFHTAIVDATDRYRANDAEAASDLKSTFIANMSHEIRTPLGAMLGFIRLLKGASLKEEVRKKYLDIIERNGSILSALVDDILDLAKIEANHLEVESIDFSLRDLLSDLQDLFHLKASEKGLLFHISTSGLPDRIISDPTRLRQILMNIIGNGIKFTARGSVQVTANCELISPNFQRVTLKITDTGTPITAAQRGRLFKKFSQADETTTRQHGGTGLGLTLARKLANALGGGVELEDSQASTSGNTFIVTFQAGVSDSHEKPTSVLPNEQNFDPDQQLLDGLRILVVDDSQDNQMLIEHLLTSQGAAVTFAENGEKAVSSALSGSHDLVLMDVQMPIMDGHEATRLLRKRGYQTPIVALSAHAMKEDRTKSLEAGCDGHLTKPISARVLAHTVSYLARNNGRLLH